MLWLAVLLVQGARSRDPSVRRACYASKGDVPAGCVAFVDRLILPFDRLNRETVGEHLKRLCRLVGETIEYPHRLHGLNLSHWDRGVPMQAVVPVDEAVSGEENGTEKKMYCLRFLKNDYVLCHKWILGSSDLVGEFICMSFEVKADGVIEQVRMHPCWDRWNEWGHVLCQGGNATPPACEYDASRDGCFEMTKNGRELKKCQCQCTLAEWSQWSPDGKVRYRAPDHSPRKDCLKDSRNCCTESRVPNACVREYPGTDWCLCEVGYYGRFCEHKLPSRFKTKATIANWARNEQLKCSFVVGVLIKCCVDLAVIIVLRLRDCASWSKRGAVQQRRPSSQPKRRLSDAVPVEKDPDDSSYYKLKPNLRPSTKLEA